MSPTRTPAPRPPRFDDLRTGITPPLFKTTRAQRIRRRAEATVATAIALAFGLNLFVLEALTPTAGARMEPAPEVTAAIAAWSADHPGIEVHVVETLSASPIFNMPAVGLASSLHTDRIWVVDPARHDGWSLDYLLAHEYHHVQQGRLVTATSPSSPAAWNPAGTASHYLTQMSLVDELAQHFDKHAGRSEHSDAGEQAADCYATAVLGHSSGDKPTAYLPDEGCGPRQIAAVLAVADGTWPDAKAVAAHLPEAVRIHDRHQAQKASQQQP